MKTNPLTVALKAKGLAALYNRSRSIVQRYGLTSAHMDRALGQFCDLLGQYGCGATFPITAVALNRHPAVVKKYAQRDIEFAVHGFTHVDYSRLTYETQRTHIQNAQAAFARLCISPRGFRSPYLSRSEELNPLLASAQFTYVSNQPFLWDSFDLSTFPTRRQEAYRRAVDFYVPWQESKRLSLPKIVNGMVEIPVSLPDDEILIDRLEAPGRLVEDAWKRILHKTYHSGMLFVLQLHPERIARCAESLSAVLCEARSLMGGVWIARLDAIAEWWKARTNTVVKVDAAGKDAFHFSARGPAGTSVIARGIDIDERYKPWSIGYQSIEKTDFTFHAPMRPFIGVSPSTTAAFSDFLRQQGYIVEIAQNPELYAYYFDRTTFDPDMECDVIAQIESTNRPLVRLGCWPNAARSALSITGDIDALTMVDYGLRFLGK